MIRFTTACSALVSGFAVCVSAEQAPRFIDLEGVLERASARVTQYFARAQSIMCLERVALQRLGLTWSAEGPARFVESELRLSWEPTPEDPTPKEARTLRQVLRVNATRAQLVQYLGSLLGKGPCLLQMLGGQIQAAYAIGYIIRELDCLEHIAFGIKLKGLLPSDVNLNVIEIILAWQFTDLQLNITNSCIFLIVDLTF